MAEDPLLIESNETTGGLVASWLIALSVAAFVAYPLYGVLRTTARGSTSFWVYLLLGLFALIAAWLLWRAWQQTRAQLSSGRMRLRLKRPAKTDAALRGTVEFEKPPSRLQRLDLELVCVRMWNPKGDNNRSSTAPWSGTTAASLRQVGGDRCEAAFELQIPAYLPATQSLPDATGPDIEFSWELLVTSTDEGVPVCGSFVVPVAAGAELSRADALGTAPGPAYERANRLMRWK